MVTQNSDVLCSVTSCSRIIYLEDKKRLKLMYVNVIGIVTLAGIVHEELCSIPPYNCVWLQAHELFQAIRSKLLDSFPPAAQFVHDAYTSTTTPVTTVGRNGKLAWRSRPRPFVVISSTSWTSDEDFGV